jgi:hypothetical protein
MATQERDTSPPHNNPYVGVLLIKADTHLHEENAAFDEPLIGMSPQQKNYASIASLDVHGNLVHTERDLGEVVTDRIPTSNEITDKGIKKSLEQEPRPSLGVGVREKERMAQAFLADLSDAEVSKMYGLQIQALTDVVGGDVGRLPSLGYQPDHATQGEAAPELPAVSPQEVVYSHAQALLGAFVRDKNLQEKIAAMSIADFETAYHQQYSEKPFPLTIADRVQQVDTLLLPKSYDNVARNALIETMQEIINVAAGEGRVASLEQVKALCVASEAEIPSLFSSALSFDAAFDLSVRAVASEERERIDVHVRPSIKWMQDAYVLGAQVLVQELHLRAPRMQGFGEADPRTGIKNYNLSIYPAFDEVARTRQGENLADHYSVEELQASLQQSLGSVSTVAYLSGNRLAVLEDVERMLDLYAVATLEKIPKSEVGATQLLSKTEAIRKRLGSVRFDEECKATGRMNALAKADDPSVDDIFASRTRLVCYLVDGADPSIFVGDERNNSIQVAVEQLSKNADGTARSRAEMADVLSNRSIELERLFHEGSDKRLYGAINADLPTIAAASFLGIASVDQYTQVMRFTDRYFLLPNADEYTSIVEDMKKPELFDTDRLGDVLAYNLLEIIDAHQIQNHNTSLTQETFTQTQNGLNVPIDSRMRDLNGFVNDVASARTDINPQALWLNAFNKAIQRSVAVVSHGEGVGQQLDRLLNERDTVERDSFFRTLCDMAEIGVEIPQQKKGRAA